MGYIMGKAEGKLRTSTCLLPTVDDIFPTHYFQSLPNVDEDILIISGNNENWHGHVTAVTCAPAHRRLGLAGRLMDALEKISEQKKCWFVDLFVRVSNAVAITMYKVS